MQHPKKIAILGATGSIGANCLNVVSQLPEHFHVTALTTHRNIALLLDQTQRYHPDMVAIASPNVSNDQVASFRKLGCQVFLGPESLCHIAQEANYDLFVNSVVGAAGFVPTFMALKRSKNVALANKETLVVGGELIMSEAQRNHCTILPIDSEHSAIFQCLLGEERSAIEELLLTASGGPFRTLEKEKFAQVTVAEALRHPNWAMGQKITIDSATMMNKGLEIIEAHWLFGIPYSQIRVLIHPQSVVHSMVAFIDGSVKAQLGVPDMRVAIQFALTFPYRQSSHFPRLLWSEVRQLAFEEPDLEKFTALSLAYEAIRRGGTMPAVLNAANEEAVHLFLKERIRFDEITQAIESTLTEHQSIAKPDIEALLASDRWARDFIRKRYPS